MHEHGYTYHGDAPITGLSTFEVDKLQLGWFVMQEKQQDQAADSETGTRKQQHKRSIKKRLINGQ